MPNSLKRRTKPRSALSRVVAENVLRFMTQRYGLNTNRPRALAAEAGVTLSTVQRVLEGNETRLVTVEALAKAFRVDPFQLLVPWEMQLVGLPGLSRKPARADVESSRTYNSRHPLFSGSRIQRSRTEKKRARTGG